MADILADLREAQALYERAGVDGADGARMMKVAADEIERLNRILDAIEGINPEAYRAGVIAERFETKEHRR